MKKIYKTKKYIGAGVLIMLLASSFAMASTFDMNMDALGGEASVSATVAEDPWDNSDMALSATNESATNQVNLDNDGDVAVSVSCAATDSAGWDIEATIGLNDFRLQCKENAAGSYINLGTTPTAVYGSLGVGVNKDFRFKFYMPSSTTYYDAQTSSITFTVAEVT